ncbi:hypothetical protein LEP1GSC133_1266 [Leptospira borgpetersenii serovar Pomona str. 200901868]|uniref:Uncharacterized protein n=1 Tax=Leptospira borgpetersenii serovar Pomona str. 200901868 TaxID=1192866 RepID=M6VWP8_LEPBO|nr:hypothetical protein LEP1GSC133_1266 [Leptospira borgpetersenii serovar Pomona str. 200901868]
MLFVDSGALEKMCVFRFLLSQLELVELWIAIFQLRCKLLLT